MLGFVETMQLVDEEDHTFARKTLQFLSLFGGLFEISDTRSDSTQCHKLGRRTLSNGFGCGRLSAAGRPPEDHRRNNALIQESAKRCTGRQEVVLP